MFKTCMADLGANRMLCWWLERFALIYFVLCFPDGSLGVDLTTLCTGRSFNFTEFSGPVIKLLKNPDQLGGDCRARPQRASAE